MQDKRNENNEIVFNEAYDLDGLIRYLDGEEAAMELMYFDEEEDRHYRNRYEAFECDRGINYILAKVDRYLEDEDNSLFIAIAATFEGRLSLYNGVAIKEEEVNLGELELGKDLVYGMLIKKREEEITFTEVVYHDGGQTSASWAGQIDDAGILTRELERLIMQFGD